MQAKYQQNLQQEMIEQIVSRFVQLIEIHIREDQIAFNATTDTSKFSKMLDLLHYMFFFLLH